MKKYLILKQCELIAEWSVAGKDLTFIENETSKGVNITHHVQGEMRKGFPILFLKNNGCNEVQFYDEFEIAEVTSHTVGVTISREFAKAENAIDFYCLLLKSEQGG